MDLGDFTIDVAKTLIGTKFDVALEDGGTTTLTLEEALPYEFRARRSKFKPKRESFSLHLVGDPAIVLPQGTYALRSEAASFDEIFIVPVGRDDEATEYEAVFT